MVRKSTVSVLSKCKNVHNPNAAIYFAKISITIKSVNGTKKYGMDEYGTEDLKHYFKKIF